MTKTVNTAWDQDRFNRVNNDGTDEAATLGTTYTSNNTYTDQAADTTFRVRFTIQQTATSANSNLTITPTLRYNYNGGGYLNEVGNPSDTDAPIRVVNEANVTDGGTTTLRLGGGYSEITGRFEDTAPGAATATFTNESTNEATEYEWALQIYSGFAGLSNGDTIALQVYNSTTALDAANAIPTFEVTGLVGGDPGTSSASPAISFVNFDGFAPTTEKVYEPTFGPQVGETNFESAYTSLPITFVIEDQPQRGLAHAEGFIPTVTLEGAGPSEKNITTLLGEAHAVGFSPTVERQLDVAPALGQAHAVGFAPTVTIERTVTVQVGEANFDGFIPTFDTALELTVSIQVGEVNVEGFAPDVDQLRTIYPSVGEANFDGFTPVPSYARTALPQVGETNFEGFIPTVDAQFESETNISPALGEVHADGFAPGVEIVREVSPQVGIATAQGFAPTVQIERTVTVTHGEAHFEGFIPSVTAEGEAEAQVQLGQVHAVGFAPSVEIVREAAPVVGEVNVEGYAPTVTTENEQDYSPSTGYANVVGFAPRVSIERTITVNKGEVHFEGFAPSITTEGETDVAPSLGEVHAVGFPPNVVAIREVVTEEQDLGAGGGGIYGDDDQIRMEDEMILAMIEEYMREVA